MGPAWVLPPCMARLPISTSPFACCSDQKAWSPVRAVILLTSDLRTLINVPSRQVWNTYVPPFSTGTSLAIMDPVGTSSTR